MALYGRNGIVVICPPGDLARWVFFLVKAAASGSNISLRHVDRADVIAEDAPASVYLCQFPSTSVINLISDGRLEAVLISLEPRLGIASLQARGHSLLEALRLYTASLTANLAIGSTSQSRIVFPAFDEAASITARRILAACRFPVDPISVDFALRTAGDNSGSGAKLSEVVAGLTGGPLPVWVVGREGEIVDNVVGSLTAIAQAHFTHPIIWPRDIFFHGDRPDSPVPTIAPVTGPSRTMLYGPYVHLPPADYRGELIIGFSGRIEDIPFLLEFWAGGTCLARLRLEGRKSGGYRGRFGLTVVDPATPVELRLRNERGAIEGEISLVEIRFYILPGTDTDSS